MPEQEHNIPALFQFSSFAFIVNEEQDFEAQNGSSKWRNSSSLVRNAPLDAGICFCDTWLLYSEQKSKSPTRNARITEIAQKKSSETLY